MINELDTLMRRIQADPELSATDRLLHGTRPLPQSSEKGKEPPDPEALYKKPDWEDGVVDLDTASVPGETIYIAQESGQQS